MQQQQLLHTNLFGQLVQGKLLQLKMRMKYVVQFGSTVAELYGEDIANKVRIQYGGSVNPANIVELLSHGTYRRRTCWR